MFIIIIFIYQIFLFVNIHYRLIIESSHFCAVNPMLYEPTIFAGMIIGWKE